MDALIDLLHRITGISKYMIKNILYSVIIISGLWIIKIIITQILIKRLKDVKKIYLSRKISGYITVIVSLMALGFIWIRSFSLLVTYLGLLSAGVAIALKDTLANIVGWFFIIWRRPFELGDRVEIDGHVGDVIDIRIFQFTLMEVGGWVNGEQSTGRVLHIPNSYILVKPLANYNKGFQYIWNEIPVLITFESNWKKAKELLIKIAKKHGEGRSKSAEKKIIEAAKKFMIFYKKLTPIVYTRVKEYGVELTIRYLCEPRKRRSSEHEIWERILEEFNKCEDIDFAYPTQRVFDNLKEGKVKLRRKKR